MDIFGKNIEQHINILSCIHEKYNTTLTSQEIESLNAAIHMMDELKKNDGILI